MTKRKELTLLDITCGCCGTVFHQVVPSQKWCSVRCQDKMRIRNQAERLKAKRAEKRSGRMCSKCGEPIEACRGAKATKCLACSKYQPKRERQDARQDVQEVRIIGHYDMREGGETESAQQRKDRLHKATLAREAANIEKVVAASVANGGLPPRDNEFGVHLRHRWLCRRIG